MITRIPVHILFSNYYCKSHTRIDSMSHSELPPKLDPTGLIISPEASGMLASTFHTAFF
jgi:hypothetical protein